MADHIADILQWSGLLTAAATCFIAAALSLYVFQEQRKSSKEIEKILQSIIKIENEQLEGKRRDEFHRWVLMQIISLQASFAVLLETFGANIDLPIMTETRINPQRRAIERKLYELQIFSGDDKAIKAAARQLTSVYPDSQTLEVLRLAQRALADKAISAWLEEQVMDLSRALFPEPLVVHSRSWTGR